MQVASAQIDPAAWLAEAAASLPGLKYLSDFSCRQTITKLMDTVLAVPELCNELSGCFAKTARLINSLLTDHLPHVQAAAYKTLVGAVCIGPPALCFRTHALMCHGLLMETLVTQGLADTNTKLFAAELLQAVVVEGETGQGCDALLPWVIWIACYEQDHSIGGIAAGVSQYLQEWRYAL